MRLLPIGENTHDKVFQKIKEGDADGALNTYYNRMSWYHFLEKCRISIFPQWRPHIVKVFSMNIQEKRKSEWYEYYVGVDYDWLKDEFNLWSIPEYPLPEEVDAYPKAIDIPLSKRHGQRHVEDYSVLEGK